MEEFKRCRAPAKLHTTSKELKTNSCFQRMNKKAHGKPRQRTRGEKREKRKKEDRRVIFLQEGRGEREKLKGESWEHTAVQNMTTTKPFGLSYPLAKITKVVLLDEQVRTQEGTEIASISSKQARSIYTVKVVQSWTKLFTIFTNCLATWQNKVKRTKIKRAVLFRTNQNVGVDLW